MLATLLVVAAIAAAVLTGEVAARTLALPSTGVVAAEAALVGAAALVARWRRRLNPPGVWLLATLTVAGGAYLVAAAEATVAGGLAPVPLALSAGLWVLEAAGIGLAVSFAVEACDVACRTRWERVVALPPEPGSPPFVSVHVAAYNEPPDMLIETIRSLEALHYPAFEIVVVDNNTPDVDVWGPVEAYCAGRPGVRFVHVDP